MSTRCLISMSNVSRNALCVHQKYVFSAYRPLVSASSLFPFNRDHNVGTRNLVLKPSLTFRTSIVEYHILQNCASRFLLRDNDWTCSNIKCTSDLPLTLRAYQSKCCYSTQEKDPQRCNQDCADPLCDEELKKLTLVQRLKAMCKNYWHVLIPIHIITSIGWFGAFYYVATSGVDIPAFLENLNLNEAYIKPFRDSSMGYIAVAYGLYKIFTPARYTVTVGGTSLTIRYLKKWVRPWPLNLKLRERFWLYSKKSK